MRSARRPIAVKAEYGDTVSLWARWWTKIQRWRPDTAPEYSENTAPLQNAPAWELFMTFFPHHGHGGREDGEGDDVGGKHPSPPVKIIDV